MTRVRQTPENRELMSWRTGGTGVASVLLIKCKTAPIKGALLTEGGGEGVTGSEGLNSTQLQHATEIRYRLHGRRCLCCLPPALLSPHSLAPHHHPPLPHSPHIHYAPFVALWPFELFTSAHNNCQIWQNGSATAILNRKLPNICPATYFHSLFLSSPVLSFNFLCPCQPEPCPG